MWHLVFRGRVAAVLAAAVVSACTVLRPAGAQAPPTGYAAYDGSPPGARACAMGTAFSSIGSDPSSVYFNPAGLLHLHNEISITYEAARQGSLTGDQIYGSDLLRNRRLIFLGLLSGGGAFSWRPLANAITRTANGADWSTDEIAIDAFTLSAAHDAGKGISTGLNVSYLSGRIGRAAVQGTVPTASISNGNGVAVDFALRSAPGDVLAFGLTATNLFGMMFWDDYDVEQLPFGLRGGFSFRLTNVTVFAADWERRFYRYKADAPQDVISHFGLEQFLGQVLALRAGISGPDMNDRDSLHTSGGLGYKSGGYSLDLAGEHTRVSGTDVFRYLFSISVPISGGS